MSRNKFRGIASTTHIDGHGEWVTKEFLEHLAAKFKDGQQGMWGYWNHLTTLPPTFIITDEEVEKRNDGDFQLVMKGERYEEEDYENLLQTDILIPEVTKQNILETIQETQSSDLGELLIRYDPRNFDPDEIDPIIDSINDLVQTRRAHYIRKAEIPQPVLFILLAFATGFFARLGEVTADKVRKKASLYYEEFNERFAQLLIKSKTLQKPDVIIVIPILNSDAVVEGAIEEADKETLRNVWPKLPELYCMAGKIITRNRQDFFSYLKFLFNPVSQNWEVNYLLTRDSKRVILGPRYIETSHPLHRRWETERPNYKVTDEKLGMSLGFIETETD
jgi:hypothetical protein